MITREGVLRRDILSLIRQEIFKPASLKEMSARCIWRILSEGKGGKEAAIETFPISKPMKRILHKTLQEFDHHDALDKDDNDALRAYNWHTLPFARAEEKRVAAYYCKYIIGRHPQESLHQTPPLKAFYYYTRADDPTKQVIKVTTHPFVRPAYTVSKKPHLRQDLHESFLFQVQGIAFTMQLSPLWRIKSDATHPEGLPLTDHYQHKADGTPYKGQPVYYPHCLIFCYELVRNPDANGEVYLDNPFFNIQKSGEELVISATKQLGDRVWTKEVARVPELSRIKGEGEDPTVSSSLPDVSMVWSYAEIKNLFSQEDTDDLLSFQYPGGAQGISKEPASLG